MNLTVLHFFGLTNLSDIQVRRYEQMQRETDGVILESEERASVAGISGGLGGPLFSELAPEDLSIIVGHGVRRNYAKGVTVIDEGADADTFYIIESGKIKHVVSDDEGKEYILSMQGEGEHFGELSLIDSQSRSASVVTIEKTSLTVVSKKNLERCLSEHPELWFKLSWSLAQRIRNLTKNVKKFAFLDEHGRVARTLLELATEKDGELVIESRLTHQELANMVGASREVVTRIMKDLEAGNYIAVENRQITIAKKRLPANW